MTVSNTIATYVKAREAALRISVPTNRLPDDLRHGYHYIATLTNFTGAAATRTFMFNHHTYEGNFDGVMNALIDELYPNLKEPFCNFSITELLLNEDRYEYDGSSCLKDDDVIKVDLPITYYETRIIPAGGRRKKEHTVRDYKSLDHKAKLIIVRTEKWFNEDSLKKDAQALRAWAEKGLLDLENVSERYRNVLALLDK